MKRTFILLSAVAAAAAVLSGPVHAQLAPQTEVAGLL